MMMQGIRNAGQTWLGKLLVAILFSILIGSFAIWGIGDIFRGGGRNTVATVGKTEIDLEKVRSAYQNEIQRLSRQFRQNITPVQARALGVDQQVLSRLVTEAALDADAAARNLTISDAAVAKSIVEDANFKGASGEFNRNMFNELLRQVGLNEASYVREQRSTIVRNQLAEAISGLTSAPVSVQEVAHRYRNERRILSFIELPPAIAGDIPAATDEVLTKFFDERKAAFRAPEYRTAQVLALTPQTLADPTAVSETDALAHYERIKARFGAPERRTVQQIVFPSLADASAAVARIRAGSEFAAIATERSVSEADLTLGTFTRVEMLDQAVAAAVFGLAANTVSEPVQGAFGYAVLRVTAVEAERVRPFADVAAEVRNDLAVSRAVQALSEVHDKIEDMRAGARPLGEIAKELKLTMVSTGSLDRQRQVAGGGSAPALPALEQLVEAMFRADIGTDNEAVRTRDNGFVWYDLTAIDQGRERTFEEVRPVVTSQWRQEEVTTRLQAKAREVIDRLGKGETLEAIAGSFGVPVTASPELTRSTTVPEFPNNVLTVAFGTAVKGSASADLGAQRGRMVFTVQSATVTPFLRTTTEAAGVSQQLGLAIGDDLLSQYVAALQTRLGVRINQTTLRNATGGGES